MMAEKPTLFRIIWSWGLLLVAVLFPIISIAAAYLWPESEIAQVFGFIGWLLFWICAAFVFYMRFRLRTQKKREALASTEPPAANRGEEQNPPDQSTD